MSEWRVVTEQHPSGKSATVGEVPYARAVASLHRMKGVGVHWGKGSITGPMAIFEAKAFHAALGKAIEIAEGYQQELDNAKGS